MTYFISHTKLKRLEDGSQTNQAEILNVALRVFSIVLSTGSSIKPKKTRPKFDSWYKPLIEILKASQRPKHRWDLASNANKRVTGQDPAPNPIHRLVLTLSANRKDIGELIAPWPSEVKGQQSPQWGDRLQSSEVRVSLSPLPQICWVSR